MDRTILTLPCGGREQDIEAMMQLYDDPSVLSAGDFVSRKEWNERMQNAASDEIKSNSDEIKSNSDEISTVSDEIKSNLDEINRQKDEITKRLSIQHAEIFMAVASNPELNYTQLSDLLGVSESKAYRLMRDLKSAGDVKRVGSNKNGKWRVVPKASGCEQARK